MSKQNCWEIKKCGREAMGAKVAELGVCPAYTETALNGIHGGKNAGRACWVITGTFCESEVQGSHMKKIKKCLECIVYTSVHEETSDFLMSSKLLAKLEA